jgi:hypothetical protein
MKRYFAFVGDQYSRGRGMEDFFGDFDSQEEAVDAIINHNPDAFLWDYWDEYMKYAVVWDSLNRHNVWAHYDLEESK